MVGLSRLAYLWNNQWAHLPGNKNPITTQFLELLDYSSDQVNNIMQYAAIIWLQNRIYVPQFLLIG